jgi:transcriptional regulator with XRE-family HTH domain
MTKSLYDPQYIEMIAQIRALREEKGISQAKLGSRIGKDQSFISRIEMCDRRIDLIEALRICEALEIRLEEIIPSDLKHLL